MEVILIRHTSVDVPPGMCYGQTDVPLKPTFETEAAVTAENLKAYLPFDHVYTSPLTRCVLPRHLLRLSRCRTGQTDYGNQFWRLGDEAVRAE